MTSNRRRRAAGPSTLTPLASALQVSRGRCQKTPRQVRAGLTAEAGQRNFHVAEAAVTSLQKPLDRTTQDSVAGIRYQRESLAETSLPQPSPSRPKTKLPEERQASQTWGACLENNRIKDNSAQKVGNKKQFLGKALLPTTRQWQAYSVKTR